MDKSMEIHKTLQAVVAEHLFRPVNKNKVIEWKNSLNAPVLTGEGKRIAVELIWLGFCF